MIYSHHSVASENEKTTVSDDTRQMTMQVLHMLSHTPSCRRLVVMLLLAIAIPTPLARSAESTAETSLTAEIAQRIVQQHLAANSDYNRGDLISRSQVTSIMKKLRSAGLQVRTERTFIRSTLRDNEYLPRLLRTPAGEQLMAQLSEAPLAYDRMHRLAGMSAGRQVIHGLLTEASDASSLQWLVATDASEIITKALAHDSAPTDFNKPTGRIYTETQLIARLVAAYEAETRQENE